MGLLKEFREFAMRGNVIDLAVGVVVGAAFGKIVSALVEKIIMPLVGFLTGGIDVAGLSYTPPVPEGVSTKPPTLGYGAFLQAIIDFLIIAAAIFMFVKLINTAKAKLERSKAEAPPPEPTEEVLLLREIRDALAQKPR
jgi:large conductance mechanosensitive channel